MSQKNEVGKSPLFWNQMGLEYLTSNLATQNNGLTSCLKLP